MYEALAGTDVPVPRLLAVAPERGTNRWGRKTAAKTNGKTRVHMADKSNAMRHAHELWLRVFGEVAKEYPGIANAYDHVDACTMYMVTRPKVYDVLQSLERYGLCASGGGRGGGGG